MGMRLDCSCEVRCKKAGLQGTLVFYDGDGEILWTGGHIDEWHLVLHVYREDRKVEMAELRLLRHQLREEILHSLTAFFGGPLFSPGFQ